MAEPIKIEQMDIKWITKEDFTEAFGKNIPKNWEAIAACINDFVKLCIDCNDYVPEALPTMAEEAWIAYWRNRCYEDWGAPEPEW